MKRKRSQPSLPMKFLRKVILSLFSMLILLSFYWASETLVKVELPSSNHPPTLYANQNRNDLHQTFIQAIQQANKSVLLIVYALTDEGIINALCLKAEEGINVKVIVDGNVTPFIERKLEPNIEVLKRFGLGRMHMKILVIDEAVTLLGSANMTTESLRMHANLVLGLHSQPFATIITQKSQGMVEEGRCMPIPEQKFIFAGQPLELWFLPDNDKAYVRIKKLIDNAQKTVRVAMFTWTRMDFAKAIVASVKRGVKVEIVMDRYAGKGANAKIAKYLKQNKIPLYFKSGNGLLHHKFLYIDGKILVNGSANWTNDAFNKNDDCFVILHDLIDLQTNQMEALWSEIIAESDK